MRPDCYFCDKLANPDQLPDDELVRQLPHSVVLLGPWQSFHGYCVVVSRVHARELWELEPRVRAAFLEEVTTMALAIDIAFHPLKMNYELLGNQVPHLHCHLFPRYESDPHKLKPVWLALERAESDPGERARLQSGPISRGETVQKLRAALQTFLHPS